MKINFGQRVETSRGFGIVTAMALREADPYVEVELLHSGDTYRYHPSEIRLVEETSHGAWYPPPYE